MRKGKEKEHLIPAEKRKKVIYLERRGREKKKMSMAALLFGTLGILCLLYCLGIGLFVNYGTKFFLIWGVLAIFFGMLSLILMHGEWLKQLPVWVKGTAAGCLIAGVLLFCFVEALILSQFHRQASPGADYVLILGAQWKENGPGYVLQKRLDRAIEYLESNPETQVIVSGGQGENEPVSEAEGMKGYLIAAGILPERIQTETASTSTYENLIFSGELLDKSRNSVVLVTSDFHVFRAVKIARKQGYGQVEGLAADSDPMMLFNNMFREFFAVLKDFAVGNL